MGKIAHVLATKGAQVYTINEAETVFEAVKQMVELNTGCLLVTEEEEIRGIVTERDYLRGIVLTGRTSRATRVREIMTSRIVVVQPDTSVGEAMQVSAAALLLDNVFTGAREAVAGPSLHGQLLTTRCM